MEFYEEMQLIASGLLNESKQGSIAFYRATPGSGPAYDPGSPTETAFPVDGVVSGVNRRYVDGTQIVESDQQIIFNANAGFIPSMTDRLVIDGRSYDHIVSVKQIPAAGTPVVFVTIFR